MDMRISPEQRKHLRADAALDLKIDRPSMVDPGFINDLLDDLLDLERENEALGQWQCESCGCRFSTPAKADDLDGVTHCSSCVAVEVQAREIAELRGLLTCPEKPREDFTRCVRVTTDLDFALEGQPLTVTQTLDSVRDMLAEAFKNNFGMMHGCRIEFLTSYGRAVESITERLACQ